MKFDAEYFRKYYHIRKQKLIDHLGGKCVSCGTTESLEFDHIDPAKKKFNINKQMSLNNSEVIEELKNIQLLCERCHIRKTKEQKAPFKHGTFYGWMRRGCNCIECTQHHDEFYKARREKRAASKQNGPLAQLA